jgi:hypothetical protein
MNGRWRASLLHVQQGTWICNKVRHRILPTRQQLLSLWNQGINVCQQRQWLPLNEPFNIGPALQCAPAAPCTALCDSLPEQCLSSNLLTSGSDPIKVTQIVLCREQQHAITALTSPGQLAISCLVVLTSS